MRGLQEARRPSPPGAGDRRQSSGATLERCRAHTGSWRDVAPSRRRLITLVGWSGQLGRDRLAGLAVNDGLRAVEAGKLSESLSPSAQARPSRLARAASKASGPRSRPTLHPSEVCDMRVASAASCERDAVEPNAISSAAPPTLGLLWRLAPVTTASRCASVQRIDIRR